MKKKLISVLAATLAVATTCAAGQITATAYTDNNGQYHAYQYSAIQSFTNANSYFLTNFGRRQVLLQYPILTVYGTSRGDLNCLFNYESIGTSYAQEYTSAKYYGDYMDGFVSSNNTYRYSWTKKRGSNCGSSSTGILSVYGSNNVTYLGSVYFDI